MAVPATPLVSVDRYGPVAVITRRNPPVNALTLAMTREVHSILIDIGAANDVRAIVMTADGGKAFGAGSDISEFAELIGGGDVVERKMAFENETFSLLANLDKPTIAALNGSAFGGGFEIALACDLIVAEGAQRVGLPEIKLGLFPGSGGPVRLARRVGSGRAAEMILTGEPISVETGLRWGVVNKVVEPGEAISYAIDWAQRLAHQSVSGLQACKRALRDAVFAVDGERAIRDSLELTRAAFAHPDAVEGAHAFLEKREPAFPSLVIAP